jgi:hypothetical protein
LLDWGVSALHQRKRTRTLADRVRVLLNMHKPRIVIARYRRYPAGAASQRFAATVHALRIETLRHSAEFAIVDPELVERHFTLLGSSTKYGIASRLAEQFGQLSSKLSHRRKPFESEPSVMAVFDAIATAVAFLGQASQDKQESVSLTGRLDGPSPTHELI